MTSAGFGRVDITVYEPEASLLGWGHPGNRAKGVRAPLCARALVVRDDQGGAVAYVVADLCIVSIALRSAVLARLEAHAERGLGPHNVLLAATHTHSGPSGYSHYLAYHAGSFGFSPHVFSTLVDRLVEVILEADDRCVPATIHVGSSTIPTHEPVLFNRSCDAYNQNPDVVPVDPAHPERATNRRMWVLRVVDLAGRPLGLVSFLGVHGTSVHHDNTLLHPDNKGLAAAAVEAAMRQEGAPPGFVALFAQEAAGDVTPNWRHDRRRGLVVGAADDDFENAEQNARIQAAYARAAFEEAREHAPLSGPFGGAALHVDLSNVTVDCDLADGQPRRTHTARVGLLMAAGTSEGPGPLGRVRGVIRAASRIKRLVSRRGGQETHATDPKIDWLEAGRGAGGRFLGAMPTRWGFHVIAPLEPMIAYAHGADLAGDLGDVPWTPEIVPVQLVRIGRLAIAAVPAEPTTVAGARLRGTLAAALAKQGIDRVVVSSYANGYAGYVATPEEYAHQSFEGACTHFGSWTLGAYATVLRRLARTGLARPNDPVPGPAPVLVPEDVLARQRANGRRALGWET